MSLATAVWSAIDALRQQLQQPSAPVVVLLPSSTNGVLLRQQLSLVRDIIRVDCSTPARLLGGLGRQALPEPLQPEPEGWLTATVADLLPRLRDAGKLEPYGETLNEGGWNTALVRSLRTLESARVSPSLLRERAKSAPQPARLQILATILEAVQAARANDALASEVELWKAARNAVVDGIDHPAKRWQAAVVVGDATLPVGLFEALGDWLARRPCRRVAVLPLENVAPAPNGMRLAAASSPVMTAEAPALGRLGRCRRRLFGELASEDATPDDPSLVLARTPDERRELAECVRRVQRAVRAGTPLDRIAITLADASQVELLRDDLHRAEIPATWQVGAPLSHAPTARFLGLCLDMANSEPSLAKWYQLLNSPELPLRKLVEPQHLAHRARWRRLLAKCGAHRGTAKILAALAYRAQELERQPELSDDLAACNGLRMAMERVAQWLAKLPSSATLGAHASAWQELLPKRNPSSEAATLTRLLEEWSLVASGPVLSRAAAARLFDEACDSTSVLEGKLSEPAIRVLPPMGAFGGAFELVCCPGLDHSRFPSDPKPDPLLPDDDLAAFELALGLRIPNSADQVDVERRRIAAVLSACHKEAWLSWPATDLVSARPRIAGRHLLEVASTLLGHRASFSDLQGLASSVGSRAQVLPAPEDALGALEQRAAEAMRLCELVRPLDSAQAAQVEALDAAKVLDTLARHRWARLLLQLHLSLHAHTFDGAVPDAWTGLVSPELLRAPGLDGEPISAAQLAQLVRAPEEVFFRTLLRAFPATRFYESSGLQPQSMSRFVRCAEAAFHAHALDPQGLSLVEAFDQAVEKELGESLRWADASDKSVGEYERMAQRQRFEVLLDQPTCPTALVPAVLSESTPVSSKLPFRIIGATDSREGDVVVAIRTASRVRKGDALLLEHLALAVQAMALRKTGAAIERVKVVCPGAEARLELAQMAPTLFSMLQLAHRRAALGWWSAPPIAFRLGAERDWDLLDAREAIETTLNLLEDQSTGSEAQ
ncbi:MAG: hypothetical protein RBU37_04065 [Myxococcota bacterium]|jgi:hypothetical protein|nr:hypothetical protein [Myxococcota bacterium]